VRRLETPQYQFALRDEAHLRALFERVLREPRGASQDQHTRALREGVCSFVRRAKADSRQVETIIVALKDIFGIPDRPNRAFTGDEDTPPPVLLARRVVRWCIEEYYGGADVPLTE
jgi:hypothetical protein